MRVIEPSNYDKVKIFRMHFPSKISTVNEQFGLITEEYKEALDEIIHFLEEGIGYDKKQAAKELADLLYVTYDTAIYLGIDIDRVFDEVHKSNMSKLGKDGKPVYREDGKVLKGPNYTPPNLEWIK